MIDRRQFMKLAAMASAGVIGAGLPVGAFGNEIENGQQVEFTSEIARELAECFASTMQPGKKLAVSSVDALYSTNEEPIGYSASYFKGKQPFGYVVFDTTVEGLIGSYVFAEDVEGLEAPIKRRRANASYRIVQLDPLSYCYIEQGKRSGFDRLGETIELCDLPDGARVKIGSLMYPYEDLFSKYTVMSMNTVEQFSAFDEDMLRSFDPSGRYACGVASGFAVCDNYAAISGSSMASDFRTLWSLINPKSNSSGWSSTVATVGEGVKRFCSKKGKTITYETMFSKPAFSKIESYINLNNLVGLGLTTDESSHMVAVEGYAHVSQGGARALSVPMLIIYDGWTSAPKYINYNYSFGSVNGVFYRGR